MSDHSPTICQHCASSNTVRNGHHPATNSQKVTCKECGRHFRTSYQRRAYRPDTRKRIDHYQDAGVSVRQTARLVKIGAATVQRAKRKLAAEYTKRIETPYPIPQNVTHVVAWSGGKDSSALVIWALKNLPTNRTRFVFCDTGWESPITYQFIDDVNHRLLGGKLIVLKSKRYASLLNLAEQKHRFPSTKARFCTEELKILPMMDWILEQAEDIAVYQGIRAEESLNRSLMQPSDAYFRPQIEYAQNPYTERNGIRKRKRTPVFQKRVMAWLTRHRCSVERPLFHWKKKDILDRCRQYSVLNPLYDLGFERVGCFPCIMENKAGIKNIADHFPEQIRMIEEAERKTGHSFFPYTKTPPRYGSKPTIKDVVRWARSQAPAETEALKCNDTAGSCMSHYQQCE